MHAIATPWRELQTELEGEKDIPVSTLGIVVDSASDVLTRVIADHGLCMKVRRRSGASTAGPFLTLLFKTARALPSIPNGKIKPRPSCLLFTCISWPSRQFALLLLTTMQAFVRGVFGDSFVSSRNPFFGGVFRISAAEMRKQLWSLE